MYKIVLTKTAMQDIRSAALYISNTLMNTEAATRLLDAVEEKIGALAETPYINPLMRDSFLAANGLPFQLVNNYMAFYIIHEETKTVSVVRFQHSKRDWISILKNDI
ncbi:MAG: type II toxin-antitoxin system RelE/ParE family toxin [Ruminococcus sp.]